MYIRCVTDPEQNLQQRDEVTKVQLSGPGVEGVSHKRWVEHGILEAGVVGMVTVNVRVDQQVEDERGDKFQRYFTLL